MTVDEFKNKYGPFDYVAHEGRPHDGLIPHSGRYEYGSGKDPYQRAVDFKDMVEQARKNGDFKNTTELARYLGMTTTQYRAWNSISKDEIRKHNAVLAQKYLDKGWSKQAIADKFGWSGESYVRSLVASAEKGSANKTKEISDILKEQVDQKKYLDIGSGVENQLGVSATRLKTAAQMLEPYGYRVERISYKQVANPKQKTNMVVLVKADPKLTDTQVKHDIYQHQDQITSPNGFYLEDDGKTIRGIDKNLASLDPKRVKVRYTEDGGSQKDGTIELRPGVEDLSLGNAHYAQVRIKVGDKHYLKGMAIYGDPKEFPKGVDAIFNTNKHEGVEMCGPDNDHSVLKLLKDDPDNPFGATIKSQAELTKAQIHYTGKDGKEHLSPINIVNEEGNWKEWKRTIASQMLSKQPVTTAKKQLGIALDRDRLALDEIEAIKNPVVKQKLLEDYAGEADTKAVDLRGAAFPRQVSQVIIPLTSIKPTEVYAPNFNDGEEVVLVRYPHGGKFEMPKLTVNNRNREGKRAITPNALDAIGINYKTAEQLSGADFDGDTVLVIPTKGQNIKVEKAREELINFNPSEAYPAYEGMKRVGKEDHFDKQKQMGVVSNLITDMTIKGAKTEEIVPVVKYSMLIIDAEKHNLNWKQAQKDFNLAGLKEKYQTHIDPITGKQAGGASTLISMAKGAAYVDSTSKTRYKDDPETGKRTYAKRNVAIDKSVVERYYMKNGKKTPQYKQIYRQEDGSFVESVKKSDGTYEYVPYKSKNPSKIKIIQDNVPKMAAVDDARRLSSGTKMEEVYASFANQEKAYANEARKAALAIKADKRDPAAAKAYAPQVASLQAKLDLAKENAPRERQANLIAGAVVKSAKAADPDKYEGPDGKDAEKKLRTQTLKMARSRTGADKTLIVPTAKEWEAIENNAVSATMLRDIMANSDMDVIRDFAMPKDNKKLNTNIRNRVKALAANGYTNSDIARSLGISEGTVGDYLYSDGKEN